MSKLKIIKEYRYACACGCDSIAVATTLRKAKRDAHPGSIEEVLAIVGDDGLVVADAYSRKDAQRVLRALAAVK